MFPHVNGTKNDPKTKKSVFLVLIYQVGDKWTCEQSVCNYDQIFTAIDNFTPVTSYVLRNEVPQYFNCSCLSTLSSLFENNFEFKDA